MKKWPLVAMMICGVVLSVALVRPALAEDVATEGAGESVINGRLDGISQNCENIHDKLVTLQHDDSRARVYLGRYYETMLSEFVMPLNVWMVAHNRSDAGLIKNQSDFAEMRGNFVADYVSYQKELESLVSINCKNEAAKFSDKLATVRKARAKVANDVAKMRELMDVHLDLVLQLKDKI